MSEVTSPGLARPGRSPKQSGYEAALERVMGLADFERSTHSPDHSTFHLERMSLLMEQLGNPELGMPTVHIAGTKGKGSTAAMVTSMLAAGGYRVGLYTSPHLHRALERIRVGLTPVSHRAFAKLVERIWPAVESVGREGGFGDVTTFEALTAMAFLHFKQCAVDIQVIEVGLGGRLDATNVLHPNVSVITSISLDHVAILGDSLERIAYEKAGIVKPGVPLVLAPQPNEVLEVIRAVAEQRQAPLVHVDGRVTRRKANAELGFQSFNLTGLRDDYDLSLPLLGDHQLENAATAVAAVETLAYQGFAVSKHGIVRGISQVRWPARLQVLRPDGKLLVVDGAHNPYSVRRLVEAVRDYFHFRRVILIFGSLGGHSARGMIAELAALSPLVLAVRSRHPRSASSDWISEAVSELGLPLIFRSESVAEATQRALELAGAGDLVLATGSLFVAAEVIEETEGIEPELYHSIKRSSDKGATIVV